MLLGGGLNVGESELAELRESIKRLAEIGSPSDEDLGQPLHRIAVVVGFDVRDAVSGIIYQLLS
eukprot:gene8957-biopygen935